VACWQEEARGMEMSDIKTIENKIKRERRKKKKKEEEKMRKIQKRKGGKMREYNKQ
jgi:hypothetical protein